MRFDFMNGLQGFLTATFVATAMLFTGVAAQAMSIRQFDHMAAQDRLDYQKFLEDGAQKILTDHSRTDDAAKVRQLFHEIHPGSQLPLGEAEFELNLDNARVRDAEKAVQNPNAPPVQVESALVGTLMKNGIELTPDFVKGIVQMAATFKPKFPQNK